MIHSYVKWNLSILRKEVIFKRLSFITILSLRRLPTSEQIEFALKIANVNLQRWRCLLVIRAAIRRKTSQLPFKLEPLNPWSELPSFRFCFEYFFRVHHWIIDVMEDCSVHIRYYREPTTVQLQLFDRFAANNQGRWNLLKFIRFVRFQIIEQNVITEIVFSRIIFPENYFILIRY